MGIKKVTAFFVLAPLLALLWLSLLTVYLYFKPYSGPPQTFEIKTGEPFSRINYRLAKKKLISSPRIFHKLALWHSSTEKLRPGLYKISSGMSMSELLGLFREGREILIDVTIAEGKNIFEMDKIFYQKKILREDEFLRAAKDQTFLSSLGIKAATAEGYLYPDTYKFSPTASAKDLISSMTNNLFKKIQSIDLGQTPFDLHRLLTLASIVEKETGAAHERPIIAGVFLNRLKKGMRLQSDPTTIYGIYETFDGNLKKKHLRQKTPYNTYRMAGLPVGPIANPGLDAIKAVLNPQKHNFLYFVSKNDGTHVFSSNYRNHLKAVRNWQKTKANRKGKSWRLLERSKRANQ
ncbi:MAG: endolytic transglycosylase MltG [Bacteriovoracales bacterium]|nr:endolytic transglycosylase MltG [Bacteriovoracales bacterium]